MVKCPYLNCKGNLELKKGKKATYVCTTNSKHVIPKSLFKDFEKQERERIEARRARQRTETKRVTKKDRTR